MIVKVKITFTLDINPDAWCLEYGVPRENVRADVQSYFEHIAIEQLIKIGCENPEKGNNPCQA